jgi:hypothetical protein
VHPLPRKAQEILQIVSWPLTPLAGRLPKFLYESQPDLQGAPRFELHTNSLNRTHAAASPVRLLCQIDVIELLELVRDHFDVVVERVQVTRATKPVRACRDI